MLLWLLVILVLASASGLGVWLYLRARRTRRLPLQAPEFIPEARQHTIVLAHGVLGFDHHQVFGRRHCYFRGIAEHLQRHGARVHTARVAALGTVPERARALADIIEDLDTKRVLILAHSMGGLDARYVVSALGLAPRVAGVICVGTPHRGSCLANVAGAAPVRLLRSLLGRAGLATDALDWLGEGPSAAFNERILDVPGVHYGCIVGETTRVRVMGNPMLLACFEILSKLRGANDGIVPAYSQRWGVEHKVVPAHHFGQIGWSPLFDARTMYLGLIGELNAGGLFCLPTAAMAAQASLVSRT